MQKYLSLILLLSFVGSANLLSNEQDASAVMNNEIVEVVEVVDPVLAKPVAVNDQNDAAVIANNNTVEVVSSVVAEPVVVDQQEVKAVAVVEPILN